MGESINPPQSLCLPVRGVIRLAGLRGGLVDETEHAVDAPAARRRAPSPAEPRLDVLSHRFRVEELVERDELATCVSCVCGVCVRGFKLMIVKRMTAVSI